MGRVSGKTAFITGAAQGLGACFARMLAAEGARVFLTDIQEEGAAQAARAINADYPAAASSCRLDVTAEDDWRRALQEGASAMGGINVLIHNAGIGSLANVEAETLENWRRVQAVDVESIFIGTKAAMPYLKASAPASIITISSIAGLIASAELVAYNAAKAAVWMMSKSIALHCAREGNGVRCNSVHPVFTRTPIVEPLIELGGGGAEGERKLARQIPLGRLAEPEDVGYAVLYLASDESRFVTGAEFKIDGGISAM